MKYNIISVLPDIVKLLSGQVVTFIFHGSIAHNNAHAYEMKNQSLNIFSSMSDESSGDLEFGEIYSIIPD